jgi:hypothetical protein
MPCQMSWLGQTDPTALRLEVRDRGAMREGW